MNMKSLSLVILASMAMPAFAGGLPKVSTKEAMQFENGIIAAAPRPVVTPVPATLYTQAANHTEPCKLPTSQDQLDRRNFRAYWDGQCKDGYAFGLGRDIAISDTHHLEEITVHHLSVPQDFPRSIVSIDFVNNRLLYGSDNQAQRVSTGTLQQFVRNPDDTMSLNISTGEGRNGGNQMLSMQTSPFEAGVIVTNVREGQPTYFYGDWTAVPGASDRPSFNVAVQDPATRRPVGYGIVRFRNGALEHQGPKGLVQLSKEYVDHLLAKIAEANTAVVAAGAETAKAQQMEREYLYAACKSGYVIEGVPAKDIPITHEICTWRDQWKDAYDRSEARFQQKLAGLRAEASAREQQIAAQRTQQQQAMQQQAAANAAAWAALNQSMQQTTNSIQQQTRQFMNYRAPQVQPIGQPSNQIVCKTFGNITKCQ